MRPHADQGTANRDQPVGEVFYMPVWGGLKDGLMVANAQYNRTYVETALAEPSVPPLTPDQNDALNLIAAIAEESCLQQVAQKTALFGFASFYTH